MLLELGTIATFAQGVNPTRIVTLGTSLTARGEWQAALAERLTECLARPVQIVNHGRNGANSQWGVGEIGAVSAEQPDIVLIEFSANDASLQNGVTRASARDNITTIVNGLRAQRPNVRIILMAMNPMNGLRGAVRPSLDDYYDLYRDLAKSLHVEFVDHRPAWRRLSESELEEAIPDGVHPTEEKASAIMAPVLADAICGSNNGGSPT